MSDIWTNLQTNLQEYKDGFSNCDDATVAEVHLCPVRERLHRTNRHTQPCTRPKAPETLTRRRMRSTTAAAHSTAASSGRTFSLSTSARRAPTRRGAAGRLPAARFKRATISTVKSVQAQGKARCPLGHRFKSYGADKRAR